MVAGGMIEVNLARDPHNRLKFKVLESGRESRTPIVLNRLKGYTFLGIRLDTGKPIKSEFIWHILIIQYLATNYMAVDWHS